MQNSKLQFKIQKFRKTLRFTLYTLRSRQQRAGFTLIELLIVIAIIGVLSTLVLVNFPGIRERARDGQRKSELLKMQAAIEQYRADQGSYPTVSNSSLGPCGSVLAGGNPAATYLQKIPCDPNGSAYYNSGNYYYVNAVPYVLAACLENKNDTGADVTSTNPGGSGTCTSGKWYVLNNP